MNLYNCKLNQVVITGDSYGMDPCLVVAERHYNKDYGYDVVTFLDLTGGHTHDSGGRTDLGYSLDHCQVVGKVSPEQAQKIKEVWGYEDPGKVHAFTRTTKCVHTEHCCAQNGCKFGEEKSCPVWLGYAKQSYGYWNGVITYPIPEISSSTFKKRR